MGARPVRIGIIGTGSIATHAHLPAYRAIPEVEIVALCDASREAVERAGEQFGVAHRYTDYADLLARADIDAVDICTPNHVRSGPAIAACEAGKHVLVQKPMALTVAEATSMIEAARRGGVQLGVIYMRRFHARYQLVKRLLDAGLVGRVTAIRERTGHNGGLRLPEESWRRSFATIAGAWSLLGIHSADLFRWYGGPVRRIAAIGKTLVSPMEGDDNFSAVLEFSSGVVGTLESCYNMIPGDNILEVYGDRGTISLSTNAGVCRCQAVAADHFPWAEHLGGLYPTKGAGGWWEFDAVRIEEARLSPFPNYFRHWVDCLRYDRTPVTTGEEGRASLEIILAGYESSAESRFVELTCQAW